MKLMSPLLGVRPVVVRCVVTCRFLVNRCVELGPLLMRQWVVLVRRDLMVCLRVCLTVRLQRTFRSTVRVDEEIMWVWDPATLRTVVMSALLVVVTMLLVCMVSLPKSPLFVEIVFVITMVWFTSLEPARLLEINMSGLVTTKWVPL